LARVACPGWIVDAGGQEGLVATGNDFERYFAATYPRLVRQLFAVVGDVGEAEDVVQEAFARAAVRWQRISAYDDPEAWVRRVALNRARSNLRRSRRALAALVRVGPVADVPELSPDATAMAVAMRRLPLRYREVLVLYYVVQLSVDETASQLGIPTGTVKSRLARGRTALARQLGEERQELRHA
jgi:RNA polymerase sigma-70 factor (ECF subfamily)